MKLIILGDTHGRTFWKYIVNTQEFDLIIFIGDYFDTHDDISAEVQMQNFLDIIEFKKNNPNKVVLLIGNHDHHYFPAVGYTGTSGYQHGAAVSIGYLLEENKGYLQMAYRHDEYLFSHAGITKTWLKNNNWDGVQPVEEFVNDVWTYKPKSFCFEVEGATDFTGDDPHQSPIWVRPNSLNEDALAPFTHIVGHTQQRKGIAKEPIELSTGAKALFIDTLGTSREYIVIEDGAIKIEKV